MIDDVSSVAGFVGAQNPGYTNRYDKRLDRTLSGLDVAHRLVVNYQYELPFGKGKALLNRGGVVNQILGGWNINGVTTYRRRVAGRHQFQLSNNLNAFGGRQTPNRVLGQSPLTEGSVTERLGGRFSGKPYFNANAFEQPEPFMFGNIGNFLPDAPRAGICQLGCLDPEGLPVQRAGSPAVPGRVLQLLQPHGIPTPEYEFREPQLREHQCRRGGPHRATRPQAVLLAISWEVTSRGRARPAGLMRKYLQGASRSVVGLRLPSEILPRTFGLRTFGF